MLEISRTTLLVLVASIFVSTSQITSAQDTSQDISGSTTLPYPEDAAVSLGMGWNLQTNKAVPNICIKNFQTYDVAKNERVEELTQGNNSFSLSQSMNVSSSQTVSIAASYAGAGGHADMSSQMNMAQNFDENRDDRYVLAKQHIITKWSAIKSSEGDLIDLSTAAKALTSAVIKGQTSDTTNAQFYEQCGHGYVARIEYGGSFYGLFNMHTTGYSSSQSFKSAFQQAVGVSYSGVVGSASADESSSTSSEKNLNKSISQNEISITVLESGGSASVAGTDIVSVLDQYRNFPLSLNSVNGGDSPATEFRMVIVPYPNMAPLTQFDAQLLTIAREYGKWRYLSTTVGKIISSEHDDDSQYTFINGVTLSSEGLENMQNMAQAKMDLISAVAGNCMDRLRGKTKRSKTSTADPCSLNATNTDFKKPGTNKVQYISKSTPGGEFETYYVPVAESDVTYLVKLPFLSSIYDAMAETKVGQSGATNYSDVIFNQVMGIYKERCGNNMIPRFCENAAKTEAAVTKFKSPASGTLYSKIQSLTGKGNLCLSVAEGGNGPKLLTVDCLNTDSTTKNNDMYFYVDKASKLVRSLTGVCLMSKPINRPTNNRYTKKGHDTPQNHWTNHYSVDYSWATCPDKYDGATPPKDVYSQYTYVTPVAVPNYAHKFTLPDTAIIASYHMGANTCMGLSSDTEGHQIIARTCSTTSANNYGEFSMPEPLFVTNQQLGLGIINAHINSASVVVEPTVANYKDIGAKGVTSSNLVNANRQVKDLYKSGSNATTKQIQANVHENILKYAEFEQNK